MNSIGIIVQRENWEQGKMFALQEQIDHKINFIHPELKDLEVPLIVQHGGENLSALIPSASKDAVNLMALLHSWDPCKRPTATKTLQHPFFQSCYYVRPSLRPKSTTIARTPPSGLLILLAV